MLHLCLPLTRDVSLQGQATDIAIQAEEILKMKKVCNQILAGHTGQPLDKIGELGCSAGTSVPSPPSTPSIPSPSPYTEKAVERDCFLSPVEAQQFGIIDKVVVPPSGTLAQ